MRAGSRAVRESAGPGKAAAGRACLARGVRPGIASWKGQSGRCRRIGAVGRGGRGGRGHSGVIGCGGAGAAGPAAVAGSADAGSCSAARFSPVNSKGSISRISASSCTTARRGSVLPLTYWLTWLLPSFDPRSAAMRIRSACLSPRPSMAWRRHEAKTSAVVGDVFTVFSPSATSTPITKLNPKFNFARVYHESSILRSTEFNFHCTSRSPHPIGTPASGCTSTCTCTSDSISPPHVTNAHELDTVHGL